MFGFQVPVKLEVQGNITINTTEETEYELDLNFYSFESQYPAANALHVSPLPQRPIDTGKKRRLSSGAVARVATACVVLGLFLGALVVNFVFKRLFSLEWGLHR